jgi:hypothetical protein
VHRLRRLLSSAGPAHRADRVEACPVDAITCEDQVPPEWQHYIDKNAAYFRNGQP